MAEGDIELLKRNARRAKTARAEVAEGAARITFADLPTAGIAGRWRFVRDVLGGVFYADNGSTWNAFNSLPNVAYADLPASANEGVMAFVTDGRKSGESAGSGTGAPVYFSNGAWRVFSSDAAVTV